MFCDFVFYCSYWVWGFILFLGMIFVVIFRIFCFVVVLCGVRILKRKGYFGKFFIKFCVLWIVGLIDLFKIICIMDKIFVRG